MLGIYTSLVGGEQRFTASLAKEIQSLTQMTYHQSPEKVCESSVTSDGRQPHDHPPFVKTSSSYVSILAPPVFC